MSLRTFERSRVLNHKQHSFPLVEVLQNRLLQNQVRVDSMIRSGCRGAFRYRLAAAGHEVIPKKIRGTHSLQEVTHPMASASKQNGIAANRLSHHLRLLSSSSSVSSTMASRTSRVVHNFPLRPCSLPSSSSSIYSPTDWRCQYLG